MPDSKQGNSDPDLGTQAREAVRSIKDDVSSVAERQREKGAEQLAGIAGAVHSAAEELGQQLPAAADYVHDAATRLDRLATNLRERNLADLLEDVRRLAHDQPLAVFGGAVVAGFAISRFLKSSGDDRRYSRGGET